MVVFVQADASVKAGKWERTKYVGVSLIGKTLAIMGFGKVRAGPGIRFTSGGASFPRPFPRA